MDLESKKVAIYENLIHGSMIKMDKLYEKCCPCAVERANPYITHQTVLLHDISEISETHNTLIISIDKLPILTTISVKELLNDYERQHNRIFDKVKFTMSFYHNQHKYKIPYISNEFVFISATGSSKKGGNFFNLIYMDSIAKKPDGSSLLSFSNHLDIEDTLPAVSYQKSAATGINYFFSYFYPDKSLDDTSFPSVRQVIDNQWHGDYVRLHEKIIKTTYKDIDPDKLLRCQNKARHYTLLKEKYQDMSLTDYNIDYDEFF